MRLRNGFLATSVTVLCLAIASGAYGQKNKLEVGDDAPGLDIERWVKGSETTIEKGQVYIVEFWATWCAPCKGSIPHLNELQSDYGDRGLTVIGVSTEEPDVVGPWVKSQGSKMAYTVAVDRRSSTDRAWRLAAEQQGIPAAFIVDRRGKIAFIGNPHPKADGVEMEEVLVKVLRGRYDPKLARAAKPMLEAARNARKTSTWRIALKQYDEVIDLDPAVFADVALERLNMMLVDMELPEEAYKYARTQLLEGHFAADDEALRMLAEAITTDPTIDREDRDMNLALEAAEAAMTASGGKSPEALATLALVEFHRGEVDKAIASQKEAWMLARPRFKDEYHRVLKTYQGAGSRTTGIRGG